MDITGLLNAAQVRVYDQLTTSSNARAVPDPRAVLWPARVPPVSNECTNPLMHDADGNVTPRLCPGGGVNVLAWPYYEGQPNRWSETLRLGRYATTTQVWRAMCSDHATISGTNPLTISTENPAAAYYGWRFPQGDPVYYFVTRGCAG